MYNYLRPLDERFQINNKPMPKPHSFKTVKKWENKEAYRDINTGKLILTPKYRVIETTWKYKLLRDDQYLLIYNEVFQENKDNYGDKPFKTLNSHTLKVIEYKTYEQDDFEAPEMTLVQADGHRYYKDVEFKFTNMGGDI